jgi:beta-lactamase regulating signal transducer with metallopeptidase domain
MMALDLNLMQGVESASRLVACSVVSGLWQGVVLAAGTGICLRLVPRTSAAVRFAIWTAVFAVLAVLPLVHAYGLRAGAVTAEHAAVVRVDVRWSFAIAALWMAVSLMRGVKLAVSAVRLRRIWKRAVPVAGCEAMLAAAGVRGVEICTSKDVDRPSVIGFFSPRILVPEELFAELPAAELEQVVLHEAGHLRRRDDWMNLLQKVSLVLVPLNPVLMWVERRLCLERELACDEDVLRLTKAPKAYATCLTNLAEHRLGRRAAALSLGAWEKRPELARRVHSILRGGEGMGRTQSRVVMAVVVMGLLGGAAELARCPQLVAFSRAAVPVAAATRVSGDSMMGNASYQPVMFRERGSLPGGGMNAAHATLLKASMPGIVPVAPVAVKAKHRRVVRAKAVPRTLESRVDTRTVRRAQGWVVLTTWEVQARPRLVFAVTEDRVTTSSYAAVPTAGGWLFIQL